MMKNIERILEIFFRRVSVEEILDDSDERTLLGEREFLQLMRIYENRYSENELRNMFSYLTTNFFTKYYAAEEIASNCGRLDVFSLLRCYSRWVLTFHGNEIVCEYNRLFHWRFASEKLSEDLLVCAFLADREWEMPINRQDFDWKPFITHNNEELRKIVKQGICENHYHLKGSAPIFQLAWISIMNNINSGEFEKRLTEMDTDRRNYNMNYGRGSRNASFAVMVTQAALIRLFLISQLLDVRISIGSYNDERYGKLELSESEYARQWKEDTERNVGYYLKSTDDLMAIRGNIYEQITKIKYSETEETYPDYAILGLSGENLRERNRVVFQGERWFLYEMMLGIYGEDPNICRYKSWFYAYLVIRETIRGELIQINKKVGFENFRYYQDRKEYFLELPFYNEELAREAVRSSILDSNVVTLEARIAPKLQSELMAEQIDRLDSIIAPDVSSKGRIFYTLHFIKTGPDKYKGEIPIRSRHYKLRETCAKQAQAIGNMRKYYRQQAGRIRGIDAANVEIGCGPEVFGQVFRFLAEHTVGEETADFQRLPQLKLTYHVGEDFLDIVSGLRAIDEAVNFLGMTCGSRLGHALALGVNVSEWYQFKDRRVIIPQQEYLDNLAWLYHMLGVLKIPDESELRDFLRREFRYYFDLIYRGALSQEEVNAVCERAKEYYRGSGWENFYCGNMYDFNIDNYYYAWALRGDDPELYRNGFFQNREGEIDQSEGLSMYRVNKKFPRKQEVRYFPEIALLYNMYHFHPSVRREGEKCVEIQIKPFWISIAQQVQKLMQRKIAEYGIGIETNPTSNYLIGTFKRYDKHPIIQFYNRSLVTNPALLQACPQLSVSINTDDQGVFNTSLENEYAYMALALEQVKDKNGNPVYNKSMIYRWIDDIRKMGIRQTFLSYEEMQNAFRERENLPSVL